MAEKPFTLKTMRLVTISVLIATLFIFGTMGYSIFQEFNAIQENPELLRPEIRATLTEQGLEYRASVTIPNRGVYPILVGLKAAIQSDGETLSESELPPTTIPPGEDRAIDLTLTIPLQKIFSDPALVQKLALEGVSLDAVVNFTLSLEPFVTADGALTINQTLGPAFADFRIQASQAQRFNETHDRIHVNFEFQNKLPTPLLGVLSFEVLRTPSTSGEDTYGYTELDLSVQSGAGVIGELDLFVERELSRPGDYLLEIGFQSTGFDVSWTDTLEVPP